PEKIVRCRRTVAAGFEVALHAAAKGLLAGPAFEHADGGRTLLIGDAVERHEDVAARGDRLANPPRRYKRVGVDRIGAGLDARRPAIVVRPPLVYDLLGDPGRECFVQPDVVPPGQRDEIAEPLMRDLVRADVCGDAPETRRRRPRLREKRGRGV